MNCAHIIISHGFPNGSEPWPGQLPSVCGGLHWKQSSPAGIWSWTEEQGRASGVFVTRPLSPGLSPMSRRCHHQLRCHQVDQFQVPHGKPLRKWLVHLKRPKSIHSFETRTQAHTEAAGVLTTEFSICWLWREREMQLNGRAISYWSSVW